METDEEFEDVVEVALRSLKPYTDAVSIERAMVWIIRRIFNWRN
jgi:hypothetical protein